MSSRTRLLFWFLPALILSACSQRLVLHSLDGERLEGRWRYARAGDGLLRVAAAQDEILVGTFKTVSRGTFFEAYQIAFGAGTIAANGPDLSAFGNVFAGMLGSANTLVDAAYGENFNPASGKSGQVVTGPLFYWTASLEGDKRAMECFLIGSAYTGHGLGRCKARTGKEYTVEF
jgi:hypothetical protein